MSRQKLTTSYSMKDLSKIYEFNEDINESRARILVMSYNKRKEVPTTNKIRNIHIENLRLRIDKLTLMRHDELMRIYSNVKIIRKGPPSPPIRHRQ
jgi:hypothetical protein